MTESSWKLLLSLISNWLSPINAQNILILIPVLGGLSETDRIYHLWLQINLANLEWNWKLLSFGM